jgi:hypothetical protein
MNKSLLSQLLDGAAFPAMLLAVAVSQIKVGPHRKDTLHHGGRVAAELRMGDRVQKNAEEYGFYTPAWSPAAPKESVADKNQQKRTSVEGEFVSANGGDK